MESLPIHDTCESEIRAVLTHEARLRERALNTTFRYRRPDMYQELIDPLSKRPLVYSKRTVGFG